MINVIGLGNTGCKIAEALSEYPQYQIYKVDAGLNVKEQKKPEDYEKKCPSFKKYFGKMTGETYVFLSASGKISGLLLRMLEQIKGADLNVVCLVSDTSLLSSVGRLQQNLVVGVMKEYARSGLIEKVILLDNQEIEQVIGEVSIDQYYAKLNEVIVYTFHTMMCLKHTSPLFETKEEPTDAARVTTFGLLDKEQNKKLFFKLDNITEERYYHSASKQELKNNSQILKMLKNKMEEEEDIVKTFAVYESDNNDNMTYIESRTHIVF